MLTAYAELAGAMALVGANVGVAKLLAVALPIPMIACLRCLLACLVLWPLARVMEGRVRVGPAVLRNLALQALFGTALYNAGLLAGLRLTTALECGMGAMWMAEGETLRPRGSIRAARLVRRRSPGDHHRRGTDHRRLAAPSPASGRGCRLMTRPARARVAAKLLASPSELAAAASAAALAHLRCAW